MKTIEQLKGMTAAELRTLAMQTGLGYQHKTEKRKLRKAELIEILANYYAALGIESLKVNTCNHMYDGIYVFENTVYKTINRAKELFVSEASHWLVYDDVITHIDNMIETSNKTNKSNWIKAKKIIELLYNTIKNKKLKKVV